MRSRNTHHKRQSVDSVGSSRGHWDFPFHPGKSSVALAAGLFTVTLMMAAVGKESSESGPQMDAPDLVSERLLPPLEQSDDLMPMTLAELLNEMGARLREKNIASRVKLQENTLRVMSNVAHYGLSRADLPPARDKDALAIADILAWAVHCHIEFSGALEASGSQASFGSCAEDSASSSVSYSCIPGKGRVVLAGIRFEGHADSVPFKPRTGPREFNNNQELSDARAEGFAQRILGCAEENLAGTGSAMSIPYEVSGYSDMRPAEANGRDPRNRRVEIHFSEPGSTDPLIR